MTILLIVLFLGFFITGLWMGFWIDKKISWNDAQRNGTPEVFDEVKPMTKDEWEKLYYPAQIIRKKVDIIDQLNENK